MNVGPDGEFIKRKDEATLKKVHALQEAVDNITALGKQSIIRCRTCGFTDKDMEYNKPVKLWFCVDCVKLARKTRADLKKRKERGEFLYDLEGDDFYDTFM